MPAEEESQLGATMPPPIGNKNYSNRFVQSRGGERNQLHIKMQCCFQIVNGKVVGGFLTLYIKLNTHYHILFCVLLDNIFVFHPACACVMFLIILILTVSLLFTVCLFIPSIFCSICVL